jgi:hypothetical protein
MANLMNPESFFGELKRRSKKHFLSSIAAN